MSMTSWQAVPQNCPASAVTKAVLQIVCAGGEGGGEQACLMESLTEYWLYLLISEFGDNPKVHKSSFVEIADLF